MFLFQEAEGQLEAEEGRVIKLQLELTQFKQESERRMGEKEDETESLRCEWIDCSQHVWS